ncbi:cdk-activating kinase assembly factor mat1 [Tubulinosema ratisbonensis]|uniref:Cdk-activating kinase assembly factor mat1 n=1 Tax=Tubulinosema ratisbonensis TaxID=291195 RepID=A0A437AP03_9MICR|nr:cdk-activating kinase assembly factor mat1 [Tubulinosema ratisbonensis]
MENIYCPVCKSDSYLNPLIKLYISPCYHKICESCLNYRYSHGMAPCYECGIQLRKVNYTSQTFEDLEVEKECRIRKRINKFIKEENDFDSLLEYYDYLEEIENLVFELINKNENELNLCIDKLRNEYKERVGRKRVKEEKKTKVESVYSDWFTDINFQPFHFDNDRNLENIFVPKEFKGKNQFTWFTDTFILNMAYHSLEN